MTRDLQLYPPGHCGSCGQPLPGRRVCSRCRKPIGKGHRYRFDGPTVLHKNCENPTGAPDQAQEGTR